MTKIMRFIGLVLACLIAYGCGKCVSSSKQKTDDNVEEFMVNETVIVEDVIVEDIITESNDNKSKTNKPAYVSPEYLAELEYNTRSNNY